jgi:hypothetical protein
MTGWPILDANMTDDEIFDALDREHCAAKASIGLNGKGFFAVDNAQTLARKLRQQQRERLCKK